MFAIKYCKWDLTAKNYIGSRKTDHKFTKRQAMAKLERMGFERWGRTDAKLCSVYSRPDNGMMAYIIK